MNTPAETEPGDRSNDVLGLPPGANEQTRNPIAATILIWLTRHRIPFLSRAWGILLGSDIGCALPKSTVIGHPYGIVILKGTQLGEHVVIMHQVSIIARFALAELRCPSIGNRVFLSAGAKIIGGVRIGDDAVIGANAVITKDVPPAAVVVGVNRIVRIRTAGA